MSERSVAPAAAGVFNSAKRASAAPATVVVAMSCGLAVGRIVERIAPSGGIWWAMGTATVAWAAAVAGLLVAHSVRWHYRTRHCPRWPGRWTLALERSSLPAAASSMGLAGVGAAWGLTVDGAVTGGAMLAALGACLLAVLVAVAAWAGFLLLRARWTKRPRPPTAPPSPAAEWVAPAAVTWGKW